MKIKKSLLTSIAAGVALGMSMSSCGVFETVVDGFDTEERAERAEGDPEVITCGGGDFDCAACGMG